MTVLCYHAVDPDWSAPISIPPRVFAAHGAWLARRRVLPLDALVGTRSSGAIGRGRDIALTFDDGFASVFEHALPVLMRYAIPATVFVVAGTLMDGGPAVDWIDRPPSAGPPRTLDRSQIREMQDAGVAIGSHSLLHADLTRLGDAQCERDLRESRLLLEEIVDRPVPFLAYPRGRHDARVRRAAERAGYTHAFGLPEKREPVGRYSIPRVGVYGGNGIGTLRIKASPAYLPLRSRIGEMATATSRPSASLER